LKNEFITEKASLAEEAGIHWKPRATRAARKPKIGQAFKKDFGWTNCWDRGRRTCRESKPNHYEAVDLTAI